MHHNIIPFAMAFAVGVTASLFWSQRAIALSRRPAEAKNCVAFFWCGFWCGSMLAIAILDLVGLMAAIVINWH